MSEWMDLLDINRNDEERHSLVKDSLWWDEVQIARENVRCIMCEAYIYRKDSKRINGYTVCNQCIERHGMK